MAGIKKKVDVVCYRPFKLGIANFSGSCNNITLDADSIQICLENKAMVSEVLKNGKRVPLDFSNFNKKNPMGYDIDGSFTDIMGPRTFSVSNINSKGNTIGQVKMNDDQPPVIIQNGSAGFARQMTKTITPTNVTPNGTTVKQEDKQPPATNVTASGKEIESKESTNKDDKKDDKKNQQNNNNKHHK